MSATTVPYLTVLRADRIPAMRDVQLWIGETVRAPIADYLDCAERHAHSEAAATLTRLLDRLPSAAAAPLTDEVPGVWRLGGRTMANDATHDAYFCVHRIAEPVVPGFLRSVVTAARFFHSEMDTVYPETESRRFAAIGLGLASLLGHMAGIRGIAADETPAQRLSAQPQIDPMRRWKQGHQVFAVLTQGLICALQAFETTAEESSSQEDARRALNLAADLFMASAAAFRFTADFPPAAYSDIVRPSMLSEQVGEGFSGLLSIDHRQLVTVLARTRGLMAEAAMRFRAEHQRLTHALSHVYDHHKFVCAEFDGALKPSLRCPNSASLPGVEQLQRFKSARMALIQPSADVLQPSADLLHPSVEQEATPIL